MKFATRLLLALLMLASPPLQAAMDLTAPAVVKFGGFMHHWIGAGENNKKEYVNSGTMLKRLRFRMGVDVYDGVTVVIIPELAAQQVTGGFGFTLLDGYAMIDMSKYILDLNLPLTLTVGQFKTPFGQNRMYVPPALSVVDYSSIYNGGSGVMQTTSFWDNGVMASWKQGTLFKLDVAWVEGLGINQPAPGGNGFGTKANNDFVGKLDITPPFVAGLTVGGSFYHGEAYAASGTPGFPNKPKVFTGAHVKYAMFGKSFAAEAEFINRDVDRGAYSVQLSQFAVDWLQLVLAYDHMMDYRNDKVDATRYLGGLNFFPGGPVRISLNQMGTAAGSSQQPVDSRTILQTEVKW